MYFYKEIYTTTKSAFDTRYLSSFIPLSVLC